MFKTSYHLFNAFGIPIKAEASAIFLLMYLLFAMGSIREGLIYALVLVVSIVLHELAHSLTAVVFGGRVRDITIQFLGGCAAISLMPRKPHQELLMAAAGPAMSFALAAAAFGIMVGIGNLFLLQIMFLVNLMLGVFNLLPAFPMDGGRILRASLQFSMSKLRATWIASRIGKGLAAFMIISSVLNFIGVRIPVPHGSGIAGTLFYYFLAGGGIFRFFIGLMIYQAAEAEYQMVQFEYQGGSRPRNPFQGFSFGRKSQPPPVDDQVIVSPPPYEKGRGERSDIFRE